MIGAGAGLSTSAGFTYSGERFYKHFSDFAERYGITDMYSGGFMVMRYPPEVFWAYWSRFISINRYEKAPKTVYDDLLKLVKDKNYFVLTTNVDHQFQMAGFDTVIAMMKQQKDMKVPSELIPHCPICGKPMTMNLRSDDKFVEDEGWHRAAERYNTFINENKSKNVVYLELGVGGNTPSIIKYPFWQLTAQNKNSTYICINLGESFCPDEIAGQSVCINADIGKVIEDLT